MFTNQMLATLIGVPSALALYYWLWKAIEKREQRELERTRIQEASIVVEHGYSPDVITAKAGRLLRVYFLRKDLSYCDEEILFPDFNRRIKLPHRVVVSTEFMPEKPGEYTFQCGKGKLKGKLIVE